MGHRWAHPSCSVSPASLLGGLDCSPALLASPESGTETFWMGRGAERVTQACVGREGRLQGGVRGAVKPEKKVAGIQQSRAPPTGPEPSPVSRR